MRAANLKSDTVSNNPTINSNPKPSTKLGIKPSDNQIYQTLFKAIHEHYLLPDTHLPEDDLAKSFNVSRTRIRKVLEQLIHEQLVVRLPNKGCFVASMSVAQIHEVFAVRRILESGLIDLLTLPLKPEDIEQLNQLCQDEDAALKHKDYGQANTLSGDFHVYLALLTENETLALTIKQLIARTSLAIAMYSKPTTMQCDNGCHHQLISLFLQPDKNKVKRYMVEHLDELENNLVIQSKPKKEVDFSSLIRQLQPESFF